MNAALGWFAGSKAARALSSVTGIGEQGGSGLRGEREKVVKKSGTMEMEGGRPWEAWVLEIGVKSEGRRGPGNEHG